MQNPKNWAEKSRTSHTCESGRRHLAKLSPVRHGKAPELGKAVPLCKIGNGGRRVGIPQRAAHLLQSPQQQIPAGADPEKLGAARLQGSLPHADQLADFGHTPRPAGVFCHGLLEPEHDMRVMPLGRPAVERLGGGQTGDQCLDQILLNRSRDLGVRQDLGSCLGQPACLRMQTLQA